MSEPAFQAYQNREDLRQYGDNGLLLFALQLRFSVEDIESIAVESLTDGADDKKCDLIYVDSDAGNAVIAQGYFAQDDTKSSAPSNKAADLNTAATWLLNSPMDALPETIKSAARELRDAIARGDIRFLEFWYVHNLPESDNVRNELLRVTESADSAINQQFDGVDINIQYEEVGRSTFDEWYRGITDLILVSDSLSVPVPGGYREQTNLWSSYCTSIPLEWLHQVYSEYGTDLFSANIREYLGSQNRDANINNGIKDTVETEPHQFWVYNNGITGLVHDFRYDENTGKLSVEGLSIVNGAQTTGAVGSVAVPEGSAKVSARFVKCDNEEIIRNIIRYNNRQNKVKPSDHRSRDDVQVRLREEFDDIPEATYTGARRGGSRDVISRIPDRIPADAVAQSLAAFHGNPVVAYNRKSRIWEDDDLYHQYFNSNTTAKHIVFAFSLHKAIQRKKKRLRQKERDGNITDFEQEQYNFLRKRGSIYVLNGAIAKSLETLLGRSVPNRFAVSFGNELSPEEATNRWYPVVNSCCAFSKQLEAYAQGSLNNNKIVNDAANLLQSLLEATRSSNQALYDAFAASVRQNGSQTSSE